MNNKNQLTLAWSIVGVLAVLLAVAAFFLVNPSPKSQNITEKEDMVRMHCSKSDQDSKDACAKDLQDMSDILREFSATFTAKDSVKTN